MRRGMDVIEMVVRPPSEWNASQLEACVMSNYAYYQYDIEKHIHSLHIAAMRVWNEFAIDS